ncbi:hypothetical protein SAVIM40S_07705 [Streptomyces avidinii]
MRPMDVPADQSSWLLGDRFEISGGPRSGGMGEVYRGVDLFDSTVVAVKFLSPSRQDESGATIRRRPNAGDLRRFSRECDMHLRLGGRGVPAHIAQELTGPRPYLVTEFVDGMDLYRFLRANRPSFPPRFCVLFQLVQILTRVHACDVVHRDVKPLNILLSEKGEVFLVDFGIALPLTPGATRHTEGGRTPGSSGYKAPEIIQGERNPGPAADLYGAACTFFQLVTGRLVFESDGVGYSGAAALRGHRSPAVRPRARGCAPGSGRPGGPDALKNPSLRPTAHEVAEVLAPSLPRFGTRRDPAPVARSHSALPGGRRGRRPHRARRTDPHIGPALRAKAGARTADAFRVALHPGRGSGGSAPGRARGPHAPPRNPPRPSPPQVGRGRPRGTGGGSDVRERRPHHRGHNDGRFPLPHRRAAHGNGLPRVPAVPDRPGGAYRGAAECRLSEEGQGAAVLDAWVEVCRDLVTMGRTAPAELVERCVELGADLDERGDADPDTVTHWSGWLRALLNPTGGRWASAPAGFTEGVDARPPAARRGPRSAGRPPRRALRGSSCRRIPVDGARRRASAAPPTAAAAPAVAARRCARRPTRGFLPGVRWPEPGGTPRGRRGSTGPAHPSGGTDEDQGDEERPSRPRHRIRTG